MAACRVCSIDLNRHLHLLSYIHTQTHINIMNQSHTLITLIITLISLFPSISSTPHSPHTASGFITGDIDGYNTTLRVISYINTPTNIQSIRFSNFPHEIGIHSPDFILLHGKTVNGRSVWHNNQYYLFFLTNPTDPKSSFGTWLIGNELGKDSGIAFLKPKRHTIVPLEAESANSKWHFLQNKDWISDNDARMVSLSEDVDRVSYNVVEYLSSNGALETSILLMSSCSASVASYFSDILQKEVLPPKKFSGKPLLWNSNMRAWQMFTIRVAIPQGEAVVLRQQQQESVVHLINSEFLYDGWRLSLRATDAGDEQEILLSLSSKGLPQGVEMLPMQQEAAKSYRKDLLSRLGSVKPGDFVWIWYQSETPLGSSCSGTVCDDNAILRCLASTPSSAVFEYFDSDRRDAMGRSVLSHATSFVTTTWNRTSNIFELSRDGTQLSIHSAFFIGSRPLDWIRDHIVAHENMLAPSLSSCFMYHAGTTLPQQFIYAAEILCVMMGAKPMTMIQYSSSSDHQWKFPLVAQLTRAIVAGQHLVPELRSLKHTINTYGSDETLIVYRDERSHLVDLLRPRGAAQALHIAPYPSEVTDGDTGKLHQLYLDQIFNSWWNGYVLGYPEQFIDSYCRNFHSELGESEKVSQSRLAKMKAQDYFRLHNFSTPIVALGSDSSILSTKVLDFFATMTAE